MEKLRLSRRAVLASLAACGLAGPVSACSRNGGPSGRLPELGDGGNTLEGTAPWDPAVLVATRLSFGPTPSMLELASSGVERFLEDQLDPSVADDDSLVALFGEVEARGAALAAEAATSEDPQVLRRRAAVETIGLRTLLRGAYSERQLHAVMCDYWADHLHVALVEQPTMFWVPAYDMDVIRAHALGSFSELLAASARSAAMLLYLDQATSRADGSNVPNENYAREVMELQTVGVDGGYDETDVVEAAHILTGWSVRRQTGEFLYKSAWHDLGPLANGGDVLGFSPSDSGVEDGEDFLAHLARLPATAKYVCHRLATRLIGEVPHDHPAVEDAAAAYLEEDTSIPAVLRSLTGSEAFTRSAPLVRRPLDLVLAGLRMGCTPPGADQLDQLVRPVGRVMRDMGQLPYSWPAPDGYPLAGGAWVHPGGMVARFDAAVSMAGGFGQLGPEPAESEAGSPTEVATALLGRAPAQELVDALDRLVEDDPFGGGGVNPTNAARALTFASPDFQWR